MKVGDEADGGVPPVGDERKRGRAVSETEGIGAARQLRAGLAHERRGGQVTLGRGKEELACALAWAKVSVDRSRPRKGSGRVGLASEKKGREKQAGYWAKWREKHFSFLFCFPISFSKLNSYMTKVKFKWGFKHTFQFKQNEQF